MLIIEACNRNMLKIKNTEQLLKNARSTHDRKAREIAIDALNSALQAVDAEAIVKSKVQMIGNMLSIENFSFDLTKFKNIYVVGGGKASGCMAQALEEVLGSRISEGAVNIPYTCPQYHTAKIKVQRASHPIPDAAGVKGAKIMLDLVDRAEKDDLVICLISGGGSSLMPQPSNGISLADKKKVTDELLKSGATITEINTVRKHISGFKGGWLAKKAYPATVVNLILSDVVGDPLDSIASGPTVPDPTTFHDAVEILKHHRLWNKVPTAVKKALVNGEKGLVPETPKPGDRTFEKVHNVIIGNNFTASNAAYNRVKNAGLNALLLTSCLEGQARDVGTMLTSVAKEIMTSGKPILRPACIVAGGETTVNVVGRGKGGRNQEIALGAALKISDFNGVVVASISTDGADGPTDAAGAMIDGKTLIRAHELGLNPWKALAENNAYPFFAKLGDLVFTGPTGTNVCDVALVLAL